MSTPTLTKFVVPTPERTNLVFRTGTNMRARWAMYARDRERTYARLLVQLRSVQGWEALILTEATKRRRRVEFVRWYGGRERRQDRVNFMASLKACLDCLCPDGRGRRPKPGIGILWDDSEDWVDDVYSQVRVPSNDARRRTVEITVSEIGA